MCRFQHIEFTKCLPEIQCPERIIPEDPHLEHVPGGGVTPGSVASFKCAPGYNLIGSSSTIGCMPRGFWKGVLPHCESKNIAACHTIFYVANCIISIMLVYWLI